MLSSGSASQGESASWNRNAVSLKEVVSAGTTLLKAAVRLQNAAREELCGEKHLILLGLESRAYGIALQKSHKSNHRDQPFKDQPDPRQGAGQQPTAQGQHQSSACRLPKQGSEHTRWVVWGRVCLFQPICKGRPYKIT